MTAIWGKRLKIYALGASAFTSSMFLILAVTPPLGEKLRGNAIVPETHASQGDASATPEGLRRATVTLSEFEARIVAAKDELRRLEQLAVEKSAELARAEEFAEAARAKKANLDTEAVRLDRAIGDLLSSSETLQRQVHDMHANLVSTERLASERAAELARAEELAVVAWARKANLDADLADLDRRLEILSQESAVLQAAPEAGRNVELDPEIDVLLSTRAAVQADINSLTKQRDSLRTEAIAATSALTARKREAKEVETRLDAMRRELAKTEAQLDEMQRRKRNAANEFTNSDDLHLKGKVRLRSQQRKAAQVEDPPARSTPKETTARTPPKELTPKEAALPMRRGDLRLKRALVRPGQGGNDPESDVLVSRVGPPQRSALGLPTSLLPRLPPAHSTF